VGYGVLQVAFFAHHALDSGGIGCCCKFRVLIAAPEPDDVLEPAGSTAAFISDFADDSTAPFFKDVDDENYTVCNALLLNLESDAFLAKNIADIVAEHGDRLRRKQVSLTHANLAEQFGLRHHGEAVDFDVDDARPVLLGFGVARAGGCRKPDADKSCENFFRIESQSGTGSVDYDLSECTQNVLNGTYATYGTYGMYGTYATYGTDLAM